MGGADKEAAVLPCDLKIAPYLAFDLLGGTEGHGGLGADGAVEGQNIAEDLYGSDDPEAVLKDYGFTSQDGVWTLEKKGFVLKVTPKIEETDFGTLRTYEVAGIEGEKTLITLPSTRYIPKEVSP